MNAKVTEQNYNRTKALFTKGYVAEQVQLAYTCTVHAAQGATGASAHALIAANTSRAGLYVALTADARRTVPM